MGLKLLIIEDDEHISSLIKRSFSEYNHSVEVTDNGEDGEYLAITNHYDVIVLDWMLPLKSGVELLANLRKQSILTPVIILSAKADIDDKVQGLEYGADDYLPKPFSFKELRARVEALYRRTLNSASNTLLINNLRIDLDKKTVYKEEILLDLTLKRV